jgi:hypothetical protein
MNRTQIPMAHDELSFGGMAPRPVPGVLSMTGMRRSWAAHGPVPRQYLVLAR